MDLNQPNAMTRMMDAAAGQPPPSFGGKPWDGANADLLSDPTTYRYWEQRAIAGDPEARRKVLEWPAGEVRR